MKVVNTQFILSAGVMCIASALMIAGHTNHQPNPLSGSPLTGKPAAVKASTRSSVSNPVSAQTGSPSREKIRINREVMTRNEAWCAEEGGRSNNVSLITPEGTFKTRRFCQLPGGESVRIYPLTTEQAVAFVNSSSLEPDNQDWEKP